MIWDDTKFRTFDFETSGTLPEYALQPWRFAQGKAWATSLVTMDHGPTRVDGGLEPKHAMMSRLLEEALDRKLTMVGWNTAFDISWFMAYGFERECMRLNWLDGMLLWRHFYIEPEYEMTAPKKFPYGLKACVERYLPQYAGYAEDVDFHDPSPAARKKLHRYNVRDVGFTYALTKMFYNLLGEDPMRLRAALLEAASLPLIAKANLDGMLIDELAARSLQQYLTDVAAEKLAALAPYGVTEKIVRSPVQLGKLMYDDWKLPVLKENTSKLTGAVTRSTDKEVLYELAFSDPRAKTLKEYREALNNKTKFADAPVIAAIYNDDLRAHPLAKVFGTYSGRLTYSSKQGKNKDTRPIGFALHQEKRDALYRSLILPPPGYTLVEFDAAGQEFRWMAIASEDVTMLELCGPGEDPHSFMGAKIADVDYRALIEMVRSAEQTAKDSRQLGKVANLSLQYRTSARKLRSVARVQYQLPMELPQAQLIHRRYQSAYPSVPTYWNKQISVTKRTGYVETFAGRRVQVVGNWAGTMGWSMGSTSINYRIQGTGADQKYLALAMLRDFLVKHNSYFGWDLHDGIYIYVPDSEVERVAVEGKKLLDNLPYKRAWGFTPPIAMPWDCKTGNSWGTLKDYKFN